MRNPSPELLKAILAAQQRRDRRACEAPPSTRIGYGNDDRDWLPLFRVGDAIQDVLALDWPAEVDAMTREVLAALGAAAVCRGQRPRAREKFWWGCEAVARTDFAAVLIWFERLGLAVDPAPWVEQVRPPLLKQATVSASELAILWYPQERCHKRVAVFADPEPAGPYSMSEGKTATGYAVRCWLAADGQPQAIEVTPPCRPQHRAAE